MNGKPSEAIPINPKVTGMSAPITHAELPGVDIDRINIPDGIRPYGRLEYQRGKPGRPRKGEKPAEPGYEPDMIGAPDDD